LAGPFRFPKCFEDARQKTRQLTFISPKVFSADGMQLSEDFGNGFGSAGVSPVIL
jgi:hypothetical protein